MFLELIRATVSLVVRLPQVPEKRTVDTIGLLSRERLELVSTLDADERWVAVPVPEGRAAWRAACAEAAEHGAFGVVVPADPRVLDLLRNPDDPGDLFARELGDGEQVLDHAGFLSRSLTTTASSPSTSTNRTATSSSLRVGTFLPT